MLQSLNLNADGRFHHGMSQKISSIKMIVIRLLWKAANVALEAASRALLAHKSLCPDHDGDKGRAGLTHPAPNVYQLLRFYR